MQIVAEESAARPEVPTVRPTKALSMLDRRGEHKKIPKAGMANESSSRLEGGDIGVVMGGCFICDVVSVSGGLLS